MADDDLADRLVAAIEETERLARIVQANPNWTVDANTAENAAVNAIEGRLGNADIILRRCAADRKIVDEYRRATDDPDGYGEYVDGLVTAWTKALELIAEYYDLTTSDEPPHAGPTM